jgi:quinol monooxygenase YgiN
MAPVTEIAVLVMKPDIKWESFLESTSAVIRSQPGCLQVRYSKKHENADHVAMFIDWEGIAAHQTFMDSEAYGPMVDGLTELLSAPVAPYHAPFEPFPPAVLNNDGGKGKTRVAEVMHAYFPADIDMVQQQAVLFRIQQFLDETRSAAAKGMSGETAHSFALEELDFKGEKSRALVGVLGWDSVEAHMAYRETDQFKNTIGLIRGMEGLKGIEVYHVTNHVV